MHKTVGPTSASNHGRHTELPVAVLQPIQEAIHDRALLRHDAYASARMKSSITRQIH